MATSRKATAKTAVKKQRQAEEIHPELFYTVKFFRDRWNLSTSAAYKLISSGQLEARRFGQGTIRVRGAAILKMES